MWSGAEERPGLQQSEQFFLGAESAYTGVSFVKYISVVWLVCKYMEA